MIQNLQFSIALIFDHSALFSWRDQKNGDSKFTTSNSRKIQVTRKIDLLFYQFYSNTNSTQSLIFTYKTNPQSNSNSNRSVNPENTMTKNTRKTTVFLAF